MPRTEIQIPHVGDIDPTTVHIQQLDPEFWYDGNYWSVDATDRLHKNDYYYSHPITSAIIYYLRGNEVNINGKKYDAITYEDGLSDLHATMEDVRNAVDAVNANSRKEDTQYGYIRRFVVGPQIDRHDFYTNEPGISTNLDNLGLWEHSVLKKVKKPQQRSTK